MSNATTPLVIDEHYNLFLFLPILYCIDACDEQPLYWIMQLTNAIARDFYYIDLLFWSIVLNHVIDSCNDLLLYWFTFLICCNESYNWFMKWLTTVSIRPFVSLYWIMQLVHAMNFHWIQDLQLWKEYEYWKYSW